MTKMKRYSIADAKTHLPQLVTAAERSGREVIIARRGKPVARIVPMQEAPIPARPAAVRELDAALAALDDTSWEPGTSSAVLEAGRGRLG
jgi:prevent-host-death family protein